MKLNFCAKMIRFGFRLFVAEICRSKGVRESRENRRLVAYIVQARLLTDDSDKETFDRHLRGKLPYYMIPARYIRLERLPISPNGKVDRAEPG